MVDSQNEEPESPDLTDTSQLWQLHISLANYAPDIADTSKVHFLDYVRPISIDDYLNDFYVVHEPDNYERDLSNEIQRPGRLLCIAGERGAGKTSAFLWVRRILKKSAPHTRFELVDIRRSYDSLDLGFLSSGTVPHEIVATLIERSFKALVRDVVCQSLFPDQDGLQVLTAWAAAGPPDESQVFDNAVTTDLHNLYAQAMVLAKWPAGFNRKQRQESLLELFARDTQVFSKLNCELVAKLRVTHLINAYLCSYSDTESVILVLDNVDRVPTDLQRYFLAACNDINLSCGSVCSMAMSIRTENARGISLTSGDERFVDVLLLDNVKYDGLLLPSLEAAHAEKILVQREAFGLKVLDEYDARNGSRWHDIQSIHLHPYQASIVSEFSDSRVHALSNNSCRTLLCVYLEFMRYIWTASERKDENGKAYLNQKLLEDPDERHMETLFVLWLHQRGNDVGIPLQNVVEHNFSRSARKFSQAASPRYLLLTCILNATEVLNALGFETAGPTWNDVVRRMKELGFDYNTIREALNSFLTPVGQAAGVIRLQHKELGATSIAEDSAEPIVLTSLGHEVLTSVINKAGYIWGVARARVRKGPSARAYYEFGATERARHVYAFCKHLVREHLRVLGLLRADWYERYGTDWTREYRSRFGIAERLQAESILLSVGSFYDHLFPGDTRSDNPFKIMSTAYSRLFNSMSYGPLREAETGKLNQGDEIMERLATGKPRGHGDSDQAASEDS